MGHKPLAGELTCLIVVHRVLDMTQPPEAGLQVTTPVPLYLHTSWDLVHHIDLPCQ